MNEAQTLAKAVLRAMAIREDSYDHAAARAASEADVAACAAHKPQSAFDVYFSTVDYIKFYSKSYEQAAYDACAELCCRDMWYAVYLIVQTHWNDVETWARDVLAGRMEEYGNPAERPEPSRMKAQKVKE